MESSSSELRLGGAREKRVASLRPADSFSPDIRQKMEVTSADQYFEIEKFDFQL